MFGRANGEHISLSFNLCWPSFFCTGNTFSIVGILGSTAGLSSRCLTSVIVQELVFPS